MRGLATLAVGIAVAAGIAGVPRAEAQASLTATQTLALSAFAGATGTYTTLDGGKNLGITAGVDLALPTYHRYRPVLEARGTYPVDLGTIAALKEATGGLRVERQFARWHPYVEFQAGRGKINYQRGGLTFGNLTYISSVSTVYSGGGGVDFDLTHSLSIRGDYQVQHWDTPFAASTVAEPVVITGTAKVRPDAVVVTTVPSALYPSVATLGVVYRFDFNHRYRRRP